MGTITLTPVSNGDSLDATVVNNDFVTIANEMNGSLDNANIKSAAAIDGSKLAAATVPAAKLSAEAWSSWSPTLTGFSGTPTITLAHYFQFGKFGFANIDVTGTSNASGLTFTMPWTAKSTANGAGFVRAVDNGTVTTVPAIINVTAASNVATVLLSPYGSAFWNSAGTKAIQGSFFIEIA